MSGKVQREHLKSEEEEKMPWQRKQSPRVQRGDMLKHRKGARRKKKEQGETAVYAA